MNRLVVALLFGAMSHPALAMTANSQEGCVVPAGLEAEDDRRMTEYISAPVGEAEREGWYEIAPVPQSVNYVADYPLRLDLEATPYFVGYTSGGPDYGDRVSSRMICGHLLTVHNGMVTIEQIDGGFATFDARDILAAMPLPSEEGRHVIEPYPVEFAIAGIHYSFVVTAIEVELVQVHRPDLEALAKELTEAGLENDFKPSEYLYPVVATVSGLLLSSEPFGLARPGTRGGARNADAMAPAIVGYGSLSFADTRREVSVDLRGTPVVLGQMLGGNANRHTATFENGFDLVMSGETLVVTREAGGSTEVDLAGWFDAQSGALARGDVLITAPAIDFSIEDTGYRLVVTLFRTTAGERSDGQLGFEGDMIMGHLFASQ